MKALELPTQEYIKSVLYYNPETGLFKWKFRHDVPKEWNTRRTNKIAGCPDSRGYVRININGRYYLAHRLAWLYMTGECLHDDIDHIDVVPFNNKWNNLRRATRSQNHANMAISSKNTSGYKGVSLFRRDGTWRSQIQVHGENIHLGYYPTPEEAHKVYLEAAIRYFGNFARAS